MKALAAAIAMAVMPSRPRTFIYERPPLAAYQLDALFHDDRYGLIEASTKSGKTHGAMAWLAERAFTRGGPGRNFWWTAPVFPQSEIAYRRLSLAIPRHLRQTHDTRLTITLPNLAVIGFKSGEKPDNLYGEDVYDAVVDEASRLRPEAWWALRSTLTKTGGFARIIGNVKGRRNWFYEMCRKAESGEPGMRYRKIRAADAVAAGVLKPEDVEDAKRTLPEMVFRELFDAEPSDDGGNPFGVAYIAACVGALGPGPAVYYGVDLAKYVDWTVAIGINASGQVCRFERFQAPWGETMERLSQVCDSRTLVDSTGVGDPILEELQRKSPGRFEGFKFTSESKQRLMEGLASAIQQKRVTFPDGPIRLELDSFEFEYTRGGVSYSAPEGMHDDCVCALALAVSGALNNPRPSWASSEAGLYGRPAKPDWA